MERPLPEDVMHVTSGGCVLMDTLNALCGQRLLPYIACHLVLLPTVGLALHLSIRKDLGSRVPGHTEWTRKNIPRTNSFFTVIAFALVQG